MNSSSEIQPKRPLYRPEDRHLDIWPKGPPLLVAVAVRPRKRSPKKARPEGPILSDATSIPQAPQYTRPMPFQKTSYRRRPSPHPFFPPTSTPASHTPESPHPDATPPPT